MDNLQILGLAIGLGIAMMFISVVILFSNIGKKQNKENKGKEK